MKRLALFFILGCLAFTAIRATRHRHHHHAPPAPPPHVGSELRVVVRTDEHGRQTTIIEPAGPGTPHGRRAPAVSVVRWATPADGPDARPGEAEREFREDLDEVRREFREDLDEADDEDDREEGRRHANQRLDRLDARFRQLDRKVRETLARSGVTEVFEDVRKLARVEIKQGDRPAPPAARSAPSAQPAEPRTVVAGLISADEDRARNDARRVLELKVAEWLEPDVPRSWGRLSREAGRLIEQTSVEPIEKDYGTMYKAQLEVDLSAARRQHIVRLYQKEQVGRRLAKMGGGLAFALVCLASLAGYIRADEATRGYYTNRLRVVTAAGVGAAGMALYHQLS